LPAPGEKAASALPDPAFDIISWSNERKE